MPLITLSDTLPNAQTDRILATMRSIEVPAAQAMTNDCDRSLHRLLALAEPLIEQKDIAGIQRLSVGLNVALQRPITQLWQSAFYAGSEQGLQEMRSALPDELLELQGSAQFGVFTDRIKALVVAMLRMVPRSFVNTPAQRSVQQRVLKLAGNFADSVLEDVRSHLIASIVPTATQGVIDRAELTRRIQGTLGVARRRAETIATTETNFAYSQGRLATFKESKLVSHILFMAIGGEKGDGRTTLICRSRSGLVIPIENHKQIAENQPPLHFSCRSTISGLMPKVNDFHQKLVDDPSRRIENRKLQPLMKGWKTTR
jgi:SPP1 gp7 family putative phage head morphogenesis protein